jgi:hypothetical protein
LKEGDVTIDDPSNKKFLELVKSAFEYKGGYVVEVDN